MRFVNDEHRVDVGGVAHRADVLFDGPEHGGTSEAGGESEEITEVGVELDDADRAVAQVVALVETRLQPVLQEPYQAAFAGTTFSGEGTDAPGLD